MKPGKINNIEDLRSWQIELRSEKKRLETEFSFRLYFLKKNIPAIVLHQIFPSNKILNERLGSLLELGLAFLVSRLTGQKSDTGENIVERFFSWISEKFQDWFGKKKEENI